MSFIETHIIDFLVQKIIEIAKDIEKTKHKTRVLYWNISINNVNKSVHHVQQNPPTSLSSFSSLIILRRSSICLSLWLASFWTGSVVKSALTSSFTLFGRWVLNALY